MWQNSDVLKLKFKVKLSLVFINHRSMKTYGIMEA
jgi:hypothetical protein